MHTNFDCIPCFVRQSLDALRQVTDDDTAVERALRRVLRTASTLDMNAAPPEMGCVIHRIIREETGSPDPYREIKDKATRIALAVEGKVREWISTSENPFQTALRFSIAGNVLDFALASHWDGWRLDESLEKAMTHPLLGDGVDALEAEVVSADSILFLGDNTGETVFDKLLIEQMPAGRVAYAVKGSPVINDATRSDALAAGIDKVAEIIDTGSDAPGTILKLCSDEFCRRFDEAGLIIAKGQANYETLNDHRRGIFFLTQVKCPVIAKSMGREVGDWIVMQTQGDKSGALNIHDTARRAL